MKSSSVNPPGILFITSYPPRECGIATFSQDLIKVLNSKFSRSFSIKVCALEWESGRYSYPDEVTHTLNTSVSEEYNKLAERINQDPDIAAVVIQHEFGLFYKHEADFRQLLFALTKSVILSFHTILPDPKESVKQNVQSMVSACESVIVMTENSAALLVDRYGIPRQKLTVIPHGTHLINHADKNRLKAKYGLTGRKVLSTFGLLSTWKSIETTLEALPAIIRKNPEVLFLVLGKTHPEVLKREGERYRNMLEAMVESLELREHVQFVNRYLPLPDLLEYLQLTDVYLFTSKDPEQAVSGTFAYAMSCACPIISTRIPHAREMLTEDTGILIDFENPKQLEESVNRLLLDESLREKLSLNALHQIVSTAWGNAAIAHARLFEKTLDDRISLRYDLPDINLQHIKHLTTDFGMIQFSKINHPVPESGYALDDNAMALTALVQHYELTKDEADIPYIRLYLNYVKYCQQPNGDFLNYVNYEGNFTGENNKANLEDANGRAIWALGYLISRENVLPEDLTTDAETIIQKALPRIKTWHSPRSMAFAIKGLYYYNSKKKLSAVTSIIRSLTDELVQLYMRESDRRWEWFESYLTYANSILPEAVLYAYMETGDPVYRAIAEESFDFLLAHTFSEHRIKVISNKSRLYKGEEAAPYGEEPIDVAYTILALDRFYEVFRDKEYLYKMEASFNWFLGDNHLHQIIYNPCTGGCYDGLEEDYVNLNQGAEATVSYLMARLAVEKYSGTQTKKPIAYKTPLEHAIYLK